MSACSRNGELRRFKQYVRKSILTATMLQEEQDMLTEIFEYYYTMNLHPVRIKPLTKKELSKGMSTEAIDKYLSMMQQLYAAFAYDVNDESLCCSSEERRQKMYQRDSIYKSLIKYLYSIDAISECVYDELRKTSGVEFKYEEHPSGNGIYISDSIEDFRLAFERYIVECDSRNDVYDDYISERYGYSVCVKPDTRNLFVKDEDLHIVHFEEELGRFKTVETSYWEIRQLLSKIEGDREHNRIEQERLDTIFFHDKKKEDPSFNYAQWTYSKPRNLAEWYSMKRALEVEATYLWHGKYNIERVFQCMKKPDEMVGTGATLFIYKGKTRCQLEKHPIFSAVAILYDGDGKEIELDIEYCSLCDRYLLSYTSFELYREKYNILIGKLRMVTADQYGEFCLAPESPLKLCGYNVSQESGLTVSERKYILAKIIHDGIMSKIEVVHYLEHFINMNGAKLENAIALEKWCEDLDFVHKYNITTQPIVYIKEIKKR